MISAQAIYKRLVALTAEFEENSQIVKTAKQFIKENVAGKFIDPKTGNIMQSISVDQIPKVDKREDLIDSYIPTVHKVYTRAAKILSEQENENIKKQYEADKSAGKKPKKPKYTKPKKAKDIKKMTDKEKKPYIGIAEGYASDVVDYEKLKYDVYDVWKHEPNYPRNSEAGDLYNEAEEEEKNKQPISSDWIARARELMDDFYKWKAEDAKNARGPVNKDDYEETKDTPTEPQTYTSSPSDYDDF